MSNSSPSDDNNIKDNKANNNNEESNRPACAACKHQRKKCRKGCSLSIHFPANKHKEFSAAHQIFGIANIIKMLKDMELEKQRLIVKSINWEADIWTDMKHKEYGPYGLYRALLENYRRLDSENRQLKQQLMESSWQGEKSSDFTDAMYSSNDIHGNQNLLLSPSVNNYSTLQKGHDQEAEGSSRTNYTSHPPAAGLGFATSLPVPSMEGQLGSHPPARLGFAAALPPGAMEGQQRKGHDQVMVRPPPGGLGFPVASPPGAMKGQQRKSNDQVMVRPPPVGLRFPVALPPGAMEGQPGKGHDHPMVPPVRMWAGGHAMVPQSAVGAASGFVSQTQNINISNYSCPLDSNIPASSSSPLVRSKFDRYHPYPQPPYNTGSHGQLFLAPHHHRQPYGSVSDKYSQNQIDIRGENHQNQNQVGSESSRKHNSDRHQLK